MGGGARVKPPVLKPFSTMPAGLLGGFKNSIGYGSQSGQMLGEVIPPSLEEALIEAVPPEPPAAAGAGGEASAAPPEISALLRCMRTCRASTRSYARGSRSATCH